MIKKDVRAEVHTYVVLTALSSFEVAVGNEEDSLFMT